MTTLEYFAPGYTDIHDVIAQHGQPEDATTLAKVANCPRMHEIRVEENLEKPGKNAKMVAGIVLHDGFEFYYAHPDRTKRVEDETLVRVDQAWDEWGIDRANMDPKATHLDAKHLTDIMESYFYEWKHRRIEIFEPIAGLTLDDLNLDQVIAAKFSLTPDGYIILGESNIIMGFQVAGELFVLAGKPDLPVRKQDGTVYAMDHKSTSMYLSDWWSKQFEVSNKLRGYMAMQDSLLGVETRGAIINGIYVGKHANNPNSKATKFDRYQFDFSPDHVMEALRNQQMWSKTIAFYNEQGYFPQGCGFGGCSHPDLCRRDPPTRGVVKMNDYVQSTRTFWDL